MKERYLNNRSLMERLIAFSGIFFALLSALPLHAEETVEAVCGDVLSPAPSASPAPQKLQYCKAAKTTQEAADTQSILWKVWAGVAGTCATECALSMTGTYTEELLCIVPLAAATAYEGYKSDAFLQSLLGLAPQLLNGGVLVDRAKNAASDEKNQTKVDPNRKDFPACMNAATSGFQAYTKYKGMKDQESATQESLKLAKSLQSETAAVTATSVAQTSGGFGGGGGLKTENASQGAASAGIGAGASNASESAKVSAGSCADKKSASGISAPFAACVVASDKNLPSWVGSPKFQKGLEKSVGKSLPEFLNDSSLTPTTALASTMSALGGSASGKLAAAIVADAESYEGRGAMDGAMYAGGGVGGAAATGGASAAQEENPLASLQGFLGGLMGGGGAGAAKSSGGVREVVFAMQAAQDGKRSPASLAEDPRLGLFSRVTVRYQLVGKRLDGGGK